MKNFGSRGYDAERIDKLEAENAELRANWAELKKMLELTIDNFGSDATIAPQVLLVMNGVLKS